MPQGRGTMRVPFSRPDITDAEIAAVVDVLRSGWLTTGPRVRELEEGFAHRFPGTCAVAVNSATAGLHLALEAVGVGAGDEVIVPTYTFAATAEVVLYLGATPRLVDVRPDTLCIDPAAVTQAISPRTKAVIAVDIAGTPCDWDELLKIGKRHGVSLIDDAAHALPAELKGRQIGQWAEITVFSFYATKTMTTAEGGMILTANPELAERMRLMSLHGLSHEAWSRYAGGSWAYEIRAAGYKYNMTDIAAALGIVQLRRLDQMRARRAAIATRYNRAFEGIRDLELPIIPSEASTSWHLYMLRTRQGSELTRDDLIAHLSARGVATSVHFIPLHMQPLYRDKYSHDERDLPVAAAEFRRVLSLPMFSAMTDEQVDIVIDAVTERTQASNAR